MELFRIELFILEIYSMELFSMVTAVCVQLSACVKSQVYKVFM
jgi:hypothetical protein